MLTKGKKVNNNKCTKLDTQLLESTSKFILRRSPQWGKPWALVIVVYSKTISGVHGSQSCFVFLQQSLHRLGLTYNLFELPGWMPKISKKKKIKNAACRS